MNNTHPLFRPPAEAHSLILRVSDGCPWNQCTFCGMYKGVKSRFYAPEEIQVIIQQAAREYPAARRIFLADGDVMAFPFETLKTILEQITRSFPRLARINLYANGRSILAKTDDQLRQLKALRLNTLYMGLESGHEPTLKKVCKRDSAEAMISAGQRAQAAGLKMSVMILIGLGGQTRSAVHAQDTADALNRMQPKLLSALRVIPVPGTALHTEEQSGAFRQLSEYQSIEELRNILQQLKLDGTVFRADHSSNILPIEGRFPKDRKRLIDELNALLNSGTLDQNGPGRTPLFL